MFFFSTFYHLPSQVCRNSLSLNIIIAILIIYIKCWCTDERNVKLPLCINRLKWWIVAKYWESFYFTKHINCNAHASENCSKVHLYCKTIVNIWFLVETLDAMWLCNKSWFWGMSLLTASVHFSLLFIKLSVILNNSQNHLNVRFFILGVNYHNQKDFFLNEIDLLLLFG